MLIYDLSKQNILFVYKVIIEWQLLSLMSPDGLCLSKSGFSQCNTVLMSSLCGHIWSRASILDYEYNWLSSGFAINGSLAFLAAPTVLIYDSGMLMVRQI